MVEHLNTVGNVPESNDSFTTWVSAGTVLSEQSNWRDVGIGFRSQDLGATFFKHHLFWKSRNSCLTHSTKLGQWVTRKKLINHTSGGNADAAVNIVLYGAYFFAKKVRIHLRKLIKRYCWRQLCTICFVHEPVCHHQQFFPCGGQNDLWAIESSCPQNEWSRASQHWKSVCGQSGL